MDLVACGSCGRVFLRSIVEKPDADGKPTAYRRDKGAADQVSVRCLHPGCGGILLRKVEDVLVTDVVEVDADVRVEATSVEQAHSIAEARRAASSLSDE